VNDPDSSPHVADQRILRRLAQSSQSFGNLTPADIYFGRGPTILTRRQNIKRKTIELRRRLHQQAVA